MTSTVVRVTAFGLVSSLLLVFTPSSDAVTPLGTVKCSLTMDHSEGFEQAHETCWKKLKDKIKEELDEDYPFNATIEEYEWDDKCYDHCIYQEMGVINKDGTLPDKKDTEKLFPRGQVSDERYKLITSAWTDCIEISGKIGKTKGFDKCKTVNHHRYCFMKKRIDATEKVEIPC